MKHGFFALKNGEWEEYKNTFRKEVNVTEWAFGRIKQAFEKGGEGESKNAQHRPRNHDKKYGLHAAHHRAISREQGGYDVIFVPALLQFPDGRPRLVGWKQPNRLLVVQTGESVNHANIFRAHAVHQGLCRNLMNALKVAGEPTRRWRRRHTEHRDELL